MRAFRLRTSLSRTGTQGTHRSEPSNARDFDMASDGRARFARHVPPPDSTATSNGCYRHAAWPALVPRSLRGRNGRPDDSRQVIDHDAVTRLPLSELRQSDRNE